MEYVAIHTSHTGECVSLNVKSVYRLHLSYGARRPRLLGPVTHVISPGQEQALPSTLGTIPAFTSLFAA